MSSTVAKAPKHTAKSAPITTLLLSELLRHRNMSGGALARSLGICHTTVSRYLSGAVRIQPAVAFQIGIATGSTPEFRPDGAVLFNVATLITDREQAAADKALRKFNRRLKRLKRPGRAAARTAVETAEHHTKRESGL